MLGVDLGLFIIKFAVTGVVDWEHVALFEFFRGEAAEFARFNAVVVENLALFGPVLGALAADDVLEARGRGAAF